MADNEPNCVFCEIAAGMAPAYRVYEDALIPHTHIFLIPTYSGDLLDRFFNALEKVQESPSELARLREASSMQQAAQMLRQD